MGGQAHIALVSARRSLSFESLLGAMCPFSIISLADVSHSLRKGQTPIE